MDAERFAANSISRVPDWGRKGVLLFTLGLSYLAFKDFSTTVSTRRADRAVLLWAYLVRVQTDSDRHTDT